MERTKVFRRHRFFFHCEWIFGSLCQNGGLKGTKLMYAKQHFRFVVFFLFGTKPSISSVHDNPIYSRSHRESKNPSELWYKMPGRQKPLKWKGKSGPLAFTFLVMCFSKLTILQLKSILHTHSEGVQTRKKCFFLFCQHIFASVQFVASPSMLNFFSNRSDLHWNWNSNYTIMGYDNVWMEFSTANRFACRDLFSGIFLPFKVQKSVCLFNVQWGGLLFQSKADIS